MFAKPKLAINVNQKTRKLEHINWSRTKNKHKEKKRLTEELKESEDVSNRPIKSEIHNFPWHLLSKEENITLSYELKNPVPHRLNQNGIMTWFEHFYQQISYHTTHLSYNEQEIKSEVRRIYENYIYKDHNSL